MDDTDNPLWRLAERRIREAMDRGDFDDLPGDGRPLELDDDTLVPEAVRVAWRVLSNAGYVPEEVRLRREIAETDAQRALARHEGDRLRAAHRLEFLRLRLLAAGRDSPLTAQHEYEDRLRRRLGER